MHNDVYNDSFSSIDYSCDSEPGTNTVHSTKIPSRKENWKWGREESSLPRKTARQLINLLVPI